MSCILTVPESMSAFFNKVVTTNLGILLENCKKTELSFPYLAFKKFWQVIWLHKNVSKNM